MKKLWIIYRENLLSALVRKNFYKIVGIFFSVFIIMSIIYSIIAHEDISGGTLNQDYSLKNLILVKRIYVFIESMVIMILAISTASFFGKDDIDLGIYKIEQRFGFKTREIFIAKQLTFFSISFVFFCPFIFMSTVFYFINNDFTLHYYSYQFFLIYLGWFFLIYVFIYSLMYLIHFFISKAIASAIISIIFSIFLMLNTVFLQFTTVFASEVPNSWATNMNSYQYNILRKEILKNSELNTMLMNTEKKFPSKDSGDINKFDFENAVSYLCLATDNKIVLNFNNQIKKSIGNFQLNVPKSSNSVFSIYSGLDKMLSFLPRDNSILSKFISIGRMQEYKTLYNDDQYFIPMFWCEGITENGLWTYKNIQVAFWSTLLLAQNQTIYYKLNQYSITGNKKSFIFPGQKPRSFNDFYVSQGVKLMLNPLYSFHDMLIGENYDDEKNYLISQISYNKFEIANDRCLNFKFIFDDEDNVIEVTKIIDTSVLYIIYFSISLLLISASYFRYKKLLNK